MILASLYSAVGLLTPYIIKGKYGIILPYGLEFVAHTNHFHGVCNLPLDVASGVNPYDRHIGSDFLALRLVKIVFSLQLGGDSLVAPEQKVLIKPLALFVDIDGHYMDMVPVYVLVLVNYERLLAEAEFLQILAGEDLKILIGQLIVGMRIERDVENRFLGLAGFRHKGIEIFGDTSDVDLAAGGKYDFVGSQQTAFPPVDFLGIVCQCTIE